MNKLLGIDTGYLFTKDSNRNIFRSAYSRTDTSLSNNNQIVIDGEEYFYNTGNRTTDTDKIDAMITKISILTCLAKSGNYDYYLVVGLPINQYKEKKDKFRNSIMQYNKHWVKCNGLNFQPHIKDVTVFAQGAGIIYGLGLLDGDYISFDVGSFTINIVYLEIKNGKPHIINYSTLYIGVLTLYDKIIKEINKRYDLTLDIEYAEKILASMNSGRGVNISAERINTDFIRKIISDYMDEIDSNFKPYYPCNMATIILNGGGANIISDVFMYRYPNSFLLPDSQFANAHGYYNFGLQKYSSLLEEV